MKVICIADDWNPVGEISDKITPKKDRIYEVVDTIEWIGRIFYFLKGFCDGYTSTAFKPLDEYLDQYTESLNKELTEVEQLELV